MPNRTIHGGELIPATAAASVTEVPTSAVTTPATSTSSANQMDEVSRPANLGPDRFATTVRLGPWRVCATPARRSWSARTLSW